MSAELFNSLTGYSVNIPPIPVIDANGNVTSNNGSFGELQVAGNVTANYFLGNVIGNVSGNFVVPGTNTSIIFNQEGNAGASDKFQFNYASNIVTLVGNLTVTRILTDNYLYANGSPFVFQAQAAGSNQQVQYNSNGILGADGNFYYDSSLELLYVENFQSDTIETYDLVVNSNATADYFIGNFVGNLSNANTIAANFVSGTLTTNAQPNITSVGNLTELTVTGTGSFLNVVASSITGNVLNGTLTTAAQPNITSLGTLIGLNVNGNGSFNNINAGNLLTANFLSGTLTTATQSNITTVGNLQSLNVVSNLQVGNSIQTNIISAALINGSLGSSSQPNITTVGTLGNLTVSGNVTANNFIGNLIGSISNANFANNANHANFANISNVAGSVTTSFQPNITSLGTLTSLNVSGNVSAGNISSNFSGNGSKLSNLTGANVTGVVSAANIANIANTAYSVSGANVSGTVANANYAVLAATANVAFLVSGSNVTGIVANANYAIYSGQANTANSATIAASANSVAGANVIGIVANANYASFAGNTNTAGTVTTNAQPNITSVGTLGNLTVSGTITAGNIVGNFSGNISNAVYANSANYANFAGQANTANNATVASSANSVTGANVTGPVSAANIANIAYSVSGANVSGTVANANFALNAGQANTANTANSATVAASANSVVGANVTGVVATAAFASNSANANIAQFVANASQPNITSLGTLTNLIVSGNVTASNFIGNFVGNITNANLSTYAINVTGASQPNITSLGNLLLLDVQGNISTNNFSSNGNISGSNLSINNVANINQANITSLTANTGNVSQLISSNITSNLITGNVITGSLATGNQSNIYRIGSLGFLNVFSNVANSNGNITFSGGLYGVGPQSNIDITGNLEAGGYVAAPLLIGYLSVNSQPNINEVGILNGLTVNGISNLGNVGNLKLYGGSANYVLTTDGLGNLSWGVGGGGNGGGSPGGLDTYVQFNDGGTFGGIAGFTFIKANNTLNVTRVNATTLTGSLTTNSQPNITQVGSLSNLVVITNTTTGNLQVTGNSIFSNVSISNALSITGNFSAGNISTPGAVSTTNLSVTGNGLFTSNLTISPSANLIVNGKFNATFCPNVFLGDVANIHITGGTNGYVLATDGAGNLTWTAQTGGGGNGTPGGSNTQIQYNDTGVFGGSPFFTFNENTNTVTVAGNLIANSFQMGAGIYRFSYSNVFQAITNTGTANQVLWSVDADEISGVDFVIVSTDSSANVRQVSKIFAVVLGSDVNYNETNTIAVNGYNGDFSVQYDPGNIITPATVGLYFSPQSANTMTHKMQITTYDN